MPEFRKLFDLPVVKLSGADISQIGRLICDGLALKPDHNDFSLSYGNATHRASSIDELMAQDLPEVIDSLSFKVFGWRDREIVQSVSVDLSRTRSSCQIISSGEEVWFRGKIQQITDFFMQRRPWYGKLRRSIPVFIGMAEASFLTVMFSSIGVGWFLGVGWFFLAFIAFIIVIFLYAAFSAFLKGRLFPAADIKICQKPRVISREVLMVIFTGAMALGSVATVIIQIMQIGEP